MSLRKHLIPLVRNYIYPFITWRSNLKEYNYLSNLIASAEKNNKFSNKTVVINIIRFYRKNLDVEGFLGLILALNGAKVIFLLDDGILCHWDTIQVDNWHTVPPRLQSLGKYNINPYFFNHKKLKPLIQKSLERNVVKKALKTYETANIRILYYSDIFKDFTINYGNLDELEKHTLSSTMRFFRTDDLDYNDKNVKYYYKLSLKNAAISRSIGEYVLKKINADYFIVAHGFYSSQGPCFEYLQKNGVKSYVWLGANSRSKDQTTATIADTNTKLLTRSRFWDEYKNTQVTENMKQKVREFFEYRYNITHNEISGLKYQNESSFLKEHDDSYKYHIAMFPNVIWDSNIEETHNVFKSFREWIVLTLNYIKERDDIKLYLRPHPAEATRCINTPRVVDQIKKLIDIESIKNLVIIPPEEKINIFQFLKSRIDLGIVYDGFLGLEIPYFKIPTIICVKKGFSTIEGGNLLINNKEDYFNYLDNIDKVIEEFHKNYNKYYTNIVRYLYWWNYIISSIRTPTMKNYYKVGGKTNLFNLKTRDLSFYNDLLMFFSN